MLLSSLIQKAAEESGYKSHLDTFYVEKLIAEFSGDPSKCLFAEDHGFIAGAFSEGHVLLPYTRVALEVAWYVEPDHRNKLVGGRLYKQFEDWAERNECEYILQGYNTKGSTLIGSTYLRKL